MERTGDPAVDAVLAEFAAAHPDLRQAGAATLACQEVSWLLVGLLRERGIAASTDATQLELEEPEPGDWHEGEYHDIRTIGYGDRWQPGDFTHCVVFVPRPQGLYMVDFTAAQYGFSEFPLVQRAVPGQGWQRQWERDPTLAREPSAAELGL